MLNVFSWLTFTKKSIRNPILKLKIWGLDYFNSITMGDPFLEMDWMHLCEFSTITFVTNFSYLNLGLYTKNKEFNGFIISFSYVWSKSSSMFSMHEIYVSSLPLPQN